MASGPAGKLRTNPKAKVAGAAKGAAPSGSSGNTRNLVAAVVMLAFVGLLVRNVVLPQTQRPPAAATDEDRQRQKLKADADAATRSGDIAAADKAERALVDLAHKGLSKQAPAKPKAPAAKPKKP